MLLWVCQVKHPRGPPGGQGGELSTLDSPKGGEFAIQLSSGYGGFSISVINPIQAWGSSGTSKVLSITFGALELFL